MFVPTLEMGSFTRVDARDAPDTLCRVGRRVGGGVPLRLVGRASCG